MLAVAWADLVAAGAFVVGVLVGSIVTLRLLKVVASYLSEVRRRDQSDDADSD